MPQPLIGKNFERSLIFSKLLLRQKGIYKRTKLMTIPNLDKDEIVVPEGKLDAYRNIGQHGIIYSLRKFVCLTNFFDLIGESGARGRSSMPY